MERKPYDEKYYDWQNGRSGALYDANEIYTYYNFLNIDVTPEFYFLDIGCRAHANAVRFFHDKGANAYGFDIGENASVPWPKYPFYKNLKVHDAHEPFNYEHKFDLISISHALEHCYDPEKVLCNIYDSLKPGGKLWCIVPIEKNLPEHSDHPHYTIFNSHTEHIDMISKNKLNVIWEHNYRGNSYIIAVK